MFKIQIHPQDNTKVNVVTECGDLAGHSINLDFNTGSALYALLLKEQLRKHYESQVEAFGKAMYEEGYKNGKGHKTKRTWFATYLKYRPT